MKKPIILFAVIITLSLGVMVYGWVFLDSQVGEATLTEETITGNRDAADGLAVGFTADSGGKLHWNNSFNYTINKTESSLGRGEMTKKVSILAYDDIRFNGWSTAPFFTQLKYDGLEGLQDKEIHSFYHEIQQRVMEQGSAEKGKVKLKDYLDYYPVSFRFKLGVNDYNSESTLKDLKVYEENNMPFPDTEKGYSADIKLYRTLNNLFKIPVIDNEYQEYKVSKVKDYDSGTSLGYKTEVKKPLGTGEDYYEFDPIIAIQQEDVKDGKRWVHPDISDKTLSQDNLKNRMLFIVNNRTAKGAAVDVSQISDGYGVYALPIKVHPERVVRKKRFVNTVEIDWRPLIDDLKMVYPLDEEAEYVEMGLSDDHRYLAIFSVKDGKYLVDVVDADNWISQGSVELFPASEKMTYSWGEDESLAVTNHKGYVAVLTKTENEKKPYEIIYSGKVPDGLDNALFDTKMVDKKNSTTKYKYSIDSGLAVTVKDGKAALVQNLLIGDPELGIRNAALACAVIDKSGVIYRGILKNNIVDLEYDMSKGEFQSMKDLLSGEADSKLVKKHMIQPLRNANWSEWETPASQ